MDVSCLIWRLAVACGCLWSWAIGWGVQGVERINYALRSRQDDVALQLDAMAAAVQQRYSIDAMQRSVAEAIAHLDS